MSTSSTGASASGLALVRSRCLALPAVTERPSHGEPAWFVRDQKMFAMFADRHHDDVLGVWCAAPPGVQEAMVQSEPGRFYRPPYVGHRGWLGVRLDVDVDVDGDELDEILRGAYRQVAPRRLLAQLDGT